jgi:hypothetical protein
MNEPDEPWVKAHRELMDHILTLQRDVRDLRSQVTALSAAKRPSQELLPVVQAIVAFLQTKAGQALIASVLTGLAALAKWLAGGH